jgi:hypothetical protein
MTIALQHQFWELAPGETYFSVTLRFGGQPKALSIPYAAIVDFVDPSVDYRLRFSVPDPPPNGAAALPATDAKPEGEEPNIVSLDQFRKK